MRIAPAAALLGLAALATASGLAPRDHDANDYYVLELDAETSPVEVARSLGLSHEGPLGQLPGHHIFVAKKAEHDVVKRELTARRRKRSLGERHVLDGVLFSNKQRLRTPWEKRVIPERPGPNPRFVHHRRQGPGSSAALKIQEEVMSTLQISDPIFKEQWHLLNTVQVGHDVNVTGLWLEGVTGKNTTVAIVDDGLDMYSDDLKDNYYAQGSYDFNDQTEEPKPRLSDDRHGTRCAGEVSAVRNNVCGVGVAYDSKIAGLRILSKLITDADEAVAMNYDFQHNLIYSCSWGPPDDGKSMDAPGILIRRAMLNAVQNGRGGLGSIYVFASGNGALNEDNCNFDGYTNSIYSITVGAIDRTGAHPYYSEKCSAGLVVTYSSGGGDAIHTTDVGVNACSNTHGGTSAAAPLAAGIFALVLQVRPDLTWRDMQYLAMDTAVPINMHDGEWQDTTIGKKFSHTYGYGKIDSYAMVQAAKTWKKVKPQSWYYSPWIHVKKAIPQGDQGIAVGFEVTEAALAEANLEHVEHVTVTMNVEHDRRGEISVDLISPNKVVSHLSVTRKEDASTEGYDDWTFMSVVHWGESGVGTWTIIVKDTKVNHNNGTFVDWHLKLWGESRDASKARPLPMPTEEDDNDHALVATTTASATYTSVTPVGSGPQESISTSAPHRPVKPKPSQPGSASASPTADQQEEAPSPSATSTWLPSFLPTFGVSASTQAWIYGSLALIVIFCSGLGIYFWIARRRRLRNNPRNQYEFELLDDEEGEGLAGGAGADEKGSRGRKGRKTRGGELYDAFAGGSDDELEFDDLSDNDDESVGGGGGVGASRVVGAYRDQVDSEDSEREVTNEKVTRAVDEDEEQHVVGDSDDEDESEEESESESDEGEARPLHQQGRR